MRITLRDAKAHRAKEVWNRRSFLFVIVAEKNPLLFNLRERRSTGITNDK